MRRRPSDRCGDDGVEAMRGQRRGDDAVPRGLGDRVVAVAQIALHL